MYVTHMHAWHALRSDDGIRSPGTVIMNGCDLPCRYQEMNLCLLQNQQVLLVAELFIQPPKIKQIFKKMKIYRKLHGKKTCISEKANYM